MRESENSNLKRCCCAFFNTNFLNRRTNVTYSNLNTKVEFIKRNKETFSVWKADELILPVFGGSIPSLELPERPIISTDITFEPMIGAVFNGFKSIVRRELAPLPPLDSDEFIPTAGESLQEEGVKLINNLTQYLNQNPI